MNRLKRIADLRARTLILNYHRVADPEATPFDRDIVSATPAQFADHLDFLSDNYEVVSLSRALHLNANADQGCRTTVAITFDDGYADNVEVAAELLSERGLTATFFIATDFVDTQRLAWWDELAWIVRHATVDHLALPMFGIDVSLVGRARNYAIREIIEIYKGLPGELSSRLVEAVAHAANCERCPQSVRSDLWMDWDQARRLRDLGMTVGGHTRSHPVLSRLSEDAQRSEILGCRNRIVEEIGIEPRYFSYPVGQPDSFTSTTKRLVREAGFEAAFSFYGGAMRAGHADRYDIPRVSVERNHHGSVFRSRTTWPTTVFADR